MRKTLAQHPTLEWIVVSHPSLAAIERCSVPNLWDFSLPQMLLEIWLLGMFLLGLASIGLCLLFEIDEIPQTKAFASFGGLAAQKIVNRRRR